MTIALATNGLIAPLSITLNLAANIDTELTSGGSCDSTRGQLILTRKNSVTLDFSVTSGGVRLTQSQLDAASSILFMVKDDPLDDNVDAVISKTIGNGIVTLPDNGGGSPNLRVSLTSTDTDIESNNYAVGLQVNFSVSDIKEADLNVDGNCFNQVFISQDVVR